MSLGGRCCCSSNVSRVITAAFNEGDDNTANTTKNQEDCPSNHDSIDTQNRINGSVAACTTSTAIRCGEDDNEYNSENQTTKILNSKNNGCAFLATFTANLITAFENKDS